MSGPESGVFARLYALRDPAFGDFQARLMPTVGRETVVGVRTPALRALAKELAGTPEAAAFLRALPHRYFDENQLHALLIGGERDFGAALAETEAFLPFVDNWATCDQLSPRAFRKNPRELLPRIRVWLGSERPYTVRFAVGMLMTHFLGERFDPEYPALVAGIRSEDYYVNMMAAWYFATALALRYDDAAPYLEEGRLPPRIRAWTIRKALESYRVPDERKAQLRALRRPAGR